jgi:predicted RNase H-like nuclease
MLLVGFDSAWTQGNSGALVGAIRNVDGTYRELGPPQRVDYAEAEAAIIDWQTQNAPTATIVLLDQPTIVNNVSGQRPVENIAGSLVSRRYGGMQPASTSRTSMFGANAPVWGFLDRFGGPADPRRPLARTSVVETYPVLTMLAMGWLLPDSRRGDRLPKYNPARRKTFSASDWRYVCRVTSSALREHTLVIVPEYLEEAALKEKPSKSDQDGLDASICLLTAVHLAEGGECLMVGNQETGYILVPFGDNLFEGLKTRCEKTGREPADWLRRVILGAGSAA